MKKVLIIVTNHATLGETNEANGTYAPELTHVVDVLEKANIQYDIASLNGGNAPLYGTDVEGDEVNARLLENSAFQAKVSNTLRLTEINETEYNAIFYPGGFGLLTDLAHSEEAGQIVARHYENGGAVAAVCHGPAGLLPVKLSSGEALLASTTVTGFTREEEIDFGTIDNIPFLLEEQLTRKAAEYRKVQPWQEFVITDGRVITGQNPASAHAVGEVLVKLIQD
jgi:putative intracellular protease/amidase